jgi:citrate synthase
MNVFWRETPLGKEELELYQLVLEAHERSAKRCNVSHQAVMMAAVGSGDYFKSIAAGLMTLGFTHGCVERTFHFLNRPNPEMAVKEMIGIGLKIPGWGSSFHKLEPDPMWDYVDHCLEEHFNPTHATFGRIEDEIFLATKGKELFANPSAYTAAAAIILGIPASISAYLLVAGRLATWTQLAAEYLKSK